MNQQNYFINELFEYYSSQGKNLSEQVKQLLNKPTSDFSVEDKQVYDNLILPARESIKQALTERLKRPGVSEDEWREQLLFYSHTIIGQIATEAIQEKNNPPEIADTHGPVVAPQPIYEKTEKIPSPQKAARVSRTWKIVIGIIIGLLIIGGGVGATLLILKNGEQQGQEVGGEETGLSEKSEGDVAIVYIREGDIYYCEVSGNEIERNDILVDELQDIDYLDVGTNGEAIVYTAESSSESSTSGGTFYVFTPSDGKVVAHHIETNLIPICPLLDGDNEIWFSAHAGGPGSSVFKFLISDASTSNITTGGIRDINTEKGKLIVTRHEYYEGGGSHDELYLTDNSGNALQPLGSFYSESLEIIAEMWSYGGSYFLGRNRTTANGGYTKEILLLDESLNPVQTYPVPEEHNQVISYDWDETAGYPLFSSSQGGLFLADIKSETLLTIDESEITYARFIKKCNAKPYSKSKPELTEAERSQIESMIQVWFTPYLDMAVTGRFNDDFNYLQFWYMLSENSPQKPTYAGSEESHIKDFLVGIEESITPMNSYVVDSIEYDGEKAIVGCICNWPAINSEYSGTYFERDSGVEFTFVKETGEWKIYDVWYEPWEE